MASQWPTGDRIRRDPVSKTGPLNATSGDTTHDDSSGQVSFVCRPVLAFVGSGAVCPGFGSWENWFQSARYSHVRPCETQ
jgi:hypothetical protein